MSRVEEIERALLDLSPDEFAQIVQRVYEMEQERWDRQLDQDAREGKLDFLSQEARSELKQGLLRDWLPSS